MLSPEAGGPTSMMLQSDAGMVQPQLRPLPPQLVATTTTNQDNSLWSG